MVRLGHFFLSLGTEHWHTMSSVVKSLTMSVDPYSDPPDLGEEVKIHKTSQEIAKFHVLEIWMFSLENWRLLLDLRSSSRRPEDI